MSIPPYRLDGSNVTRTALPRKKCVQLSMHDAFAPFWTVAASFHPFKHPRQTSMSGNQCSVYIVYLYGVSIVSMVGR